MVVEPNSAAEQSQSWAFFFMYEGVMTGGPKRTFDTALASQKYGITPVLVSNQTNPLFESAEKRGIKTRVIDIPKTLWQRQGAAISLSPLKALGTLRDLRYVANQIEKVISAEQLTGWWSRGVKNVLMAARATRRSDVPLVWDIGSEYRSRGLVVIIHWLAFRASKKIVCQGRHVMSQTFPAWLRNRFDNKIQSLIPGLEISRVERLQKVFDNYDRNCPISIVGTVNRRKNQMDLIAACNELIDRGKKLSIKIVGDTPDREYLAQCKALTQNYKDRYQWYGWTDDIAKVLNESSALVMASKSEGLPQVVLEAMHAGRPVISVPVGAVPDLISDGENGFLTERICKSQLAEKIVDFLDASNEKLNLLRQAAKRTVETIADHGNWQKNYAELLLAMGNGHCLQTTASLL